MALSLLKWLNCREGKLQLKSSQEVFAMMRQDGSEDRAADCTQISTATIIKASYNWSGNYDSCLYQVPKASPPLQQIGGPPFLIHSLSLYNAKINSFHCVHSC